MKMAGGAVKLKVGQGIVVILPNGSYFQVQAVSSNCANVMPCKGALVSIKHG